MLVVLCAMMIRLVLLLTYWDVIRLGLMFGQRHLRLLLSYPMMPVLSVNVLMTVWILLWGCAFGCVPGLQSRATVFCVLVYVRRSVGILGLS